MAVRNAKGIERSIPIIENSYFRTKFEPELDSFSLIYRGGWPPESIRWA
jgi:hypothetical protein